MASNSSEDLEILKRFSEQREGEELVFILRRHPITLLPILLTVSFLAILPMFFYIVIMPLVLPGFLYQPYQNIFFLLTAIFHGLVWLIAFLEWSNYYLDIFLVTNKRLMSIKQMGLFHRIVSELELENIQDITSVIEGPIKTLFDYGDLQIQTASEENKIQPKSIPNPVAVRRKIMELCEAIDKEQHGHQ